jgi:hypothetical protein
MYVTVENLLQRSTCVERLFDDLGFDTHGLTGDLRKRLRRRRARIQKNWQTCHPFSPIEPASTVEPSSITVTKESNELRGK